MALCFEWAGCFMPRDVLPPFHKIVTHTEQCDCVTGTQGGWTRGAGCRLQAFM